MSDDLRMSVNHVGIAKIQAEGHGVWRIGLYPSNVVPPCCTTATCPCRWTIVGDFGTLGRDRGVKG